MVGGGSLVKQTHQDSASVLVLTPIERGGGGRERERENARKEESEKDSSRCNLRDCFLAHMQPYRPIVASWSSCWDTIVLSSRGFSKFSLNTVSTDSSLDVTYAFVICVKYCLSYQDLQMYVLHLYVQYTYIIILYLGHIGVQ